MYSTTRNSKIKIRIYHGEDTKTKPAPKKITTVAAMMYSERMVAVLFK